MNADEIRINIDDTYMNVIRFGHGKKNLVMLSGISLLGLEGMGEAVAEAYRAFWDEYTVYLFDRRRMMPASFTTEQMVEDVLYCLGELGVDRADFFGASHGGMMALLIALQKPEIMNKLFLASSCARAHGTCVSVMEHWIALARQRDIRALNTDFVRRVFTPALAENYLSSMGDALTAGTEADCDRFIVLCRAVMDFDVLERLHEITVPAAVVGAEGDAVLTKEASEELARGLGCSLYLYPGYGHAVYDEAPDYKGRILKFFRS